MYLPSSILAGALEPGKPLLSVPVLKTQPALGARTAKPQTVGRPTVRETDTEIITTTRSVSADGKPRVQVTKAPKNKAFMDGLTPKQKEIVDGLKPADRNTILPLLGKTVGKTADTSIPLPEGYFWYKRSDGSLTVLRQDKKLLELVVQKEKGQPAKLTLKADGEALEGYQPRISGPPQV